MVEADVLSELFGGPVRSIHCGLRNEALLPLRAGHATRYRPYDWRAGAGLARQVIEVPPTLVIVVDGVYSGRPELRNEIDLAVLVEPHGANGTAG